MNAAAAHESVPPEYRALLFHFVPWRPQDSLAVAFALVLDLTDSWNDVIARDAVEREIGPRATAAFFSLTDPAYAAPTAGGAPVKLPPLPALDGVHAPAVVSWSGDNPHDVLGSNEWTAGAARTASGRALLANDPHLVRRIPGIWHLVDLEAPGEHVAGAAIAGVPGVILGHNEHLAWGLTYADAVAPRVYRETFETVTGRRYLAGTKYVDGTIRREIFNDRFGAPRTREYLSTRHGFVIDSSGATRDAVQWQPAVDARSPVAAFSALDRASTIEEALAALARYPGPTQNFALAQTDGRVAYTVAGCDSQRSRLGAARRRRRTRAGRRAGVRAVRAAAARRTLARRRSRSTPTTCPTAPAIRTGSAPRSPHPIARPRSRRGCTRVRVDVAGSHAIQADTTSLAEREFARLCVAALHRERRGPRSRRRAGLRRAGVVRRPLRSEFARCDGHPARALRRDARSDRLAHERRRRRWTICATDRRS